MSKLAFGCLAFIGLIVFGIVCLVSPLVNVGCDWASDGARTAHKEFDPSALLRKYEWFKDAAAQLDQKVATIGTAGGQLESAKSLYGADATKWPRDVRETYAQNRAEVTGVKASYNALAAEYNAQMAKVNYRFCNLGDLPQGAKTVVPREYRAYLYE